jgi:hypothetical protein
MADCKPSEPFSVGLMTERHAVSAVTAENGWLDQTLAIALSASGNLHQAMTRMRVPHGVLNRLERPITACAFCDDAANKRAQLVVRYLHGRLDDR